MNKEIKEKIAEMIRAAKGSQFVNYCNSDISAELSLAKFYPEGETVYFKKKIFDLKLQINDQSLIGKAWISGYCQPDIFNSGWIQLHTETLLKPEYKFDEKEAFRQLKLFLDQYVLLSNYEKVVRGNETRESNIEPIIESEPEHDNYVLKNESVILKLFEKYGAYFPQEKKEIWKQRWINGNDTLTAINIDTFKNGNNKHLILTILHEAHRPRFLKVDNMAVYTKKRWGLSSYHSDLTKYLGFDKVKNCYADPHPELKNITDILKLEQI